MLDGVDFQAMTNGDTALFAGSVVLSHLAHKRQPERTSQPERTVIPPASAARRFFGKLLGVPGKPVAAPRAEVQKAIAALAKALKEAGERLEAGEAPDAEPIERAKQAILTVLANSDGDTAFNARLQKFLRSTLVELIAVLSSGSIASAKPICDRVQREFDELSRQQNFWEASV
jgi:hypothetical protein